MKLLRAATALPALLLLAGCAQKQRPAVEYTTDDWKFARQPGWKITTAHYEVYTTLRDPVLRAAIPDFMETAYAEYARLVPPANPPAEPMRVFLLKSRQEWELFTRNFAPDHADTLLKIRNGGYSERGVSVIEYVSHEITFPLLGHEGFHQYLHHCVNTRIPAWLNEGLAVVCEGQRWGDARIESFDPWFNPARTNALAEAVSTNKLHALRTLLATNAGEMVDKSDRAIATYYAQVWALVLFLQTDRVQDKPGPYALGYAKMINALHDLRLETFARAAALSETAAPASFGEELFRAFIRTDLDQVERDYRTFLAHAFVHR